MKKGNILFVVWIVLAVGVVAITARFGTPYLFGAIEHLSDGELVAVFTEIALLCLLSFISFYLAHEQPLPSFVTALFLGIAAQPLLIPIIEHREVLAAIVTLGATMILFQGGWETSFRDFRSLFLKIALLAFPGVLITAFLFSTVSVYAGALVGSLIPATVAVLLGAVLASTDPAAIIPLLRPLKFVRGAPKDIAVSESAMNDVVGALLTITLIGVLSATGGSFSSVPAGFGTLFTWSSATVLAEQLLFGVGFGILGYGLLLTLVKRKESHDDEYGADAAFLLFVPVIAFAGALLFGGSGYLAAFIAGLIFSASGKLHNTEHFYNQTIDGFAKPAIFILLGALVDVPALIHYAPVGVLSAVLFICIIRPLMVFSMLGVFLFVGKERMSVRELLFLSWVRETGAIPAVLLVTVMSIGLPDMEALVPIGMWVILATLTIQPPLTPWLARRLGIAT